MKVKKRAKGKGKDAAMPRTSVSFPPEIYKTLEDLATKKKVSIGWVVRDAVEKYVADQWPLFAKMKGN
jgi:predicted transcriptional regulator